MQNIIAGFQGALEAILGPGGIFFDPIAVVVLLFVCFGAGARMMGWNMARYLLAGMTGVFLLSILGAGDAKSAYVFGGLTGLLVFYTLVGVLIVEVISRFSESK